MISVPEQSAAVVRITVPRTDIRVVLPSAIKELRTALAAQGIATAGPIFTHRMAMDGAAFDAEVGFPIDCPLAESGRVRSGGLPVTTLAHATYRGGYESLSAAWDELRQWIEANGHRCAANLWKVYVSGPEAGRDTSAWRTELNLPLDR